MPNKSKKSNQISRRGVLPMLGSGLLIPFLEFSNYSKVETAVLDEEYEILLKSDGTTIKVKSSTLKKSKISKKTVSNRSFLNWLDRKF